MKLEEELVRCQEWLQSDLNKGGNTHELEDVVYVVRRGEINF